MVTGPAPARRGPTFWWIQYLRGLAAAGVVIFHYYEIPPAGRSFQIGKHGVDVFFVISGFIMYSAARDERLAPFISRRLIRVFPLYWLATMLAIIIYFGFDGTYPSATEAVLSLTLIPHYSEVHTSYISPILIPGWTLSYELLFYALFGLGIAARRVVAVPVLAIGALVTLGVIFKPQLAPLVVATNPLLIEFLLGLLIAWVLHRRSTILPGIAFAALALALGGIAWDASRVAVFAGATAIVSGALWLEHRTPGKPVPSLRLLGDASYSIYLFHVPFLFGFHRLIILPLGDLSLFAADALALAAIGSAIGVGVVLHLVIEEPGLRLLNGWSRRLLTRAAPALSPQKLDQAAPAGNCAQQTPVGQQPQRSDSSTSSLEIAVSQPGQKSTPD